MTHCNYLVVRYLLEQAKGAELRFPPYRLRAVGYRRGAKTAAPTPAGAERTLPRGSGSTCLGGKSMIANDG